MGKYSDSFKEVVSSDVFNIEYPIDSQVNVFTLPMIFKSIENDSVIRAYYKSGEFKDEKNVSTDFCNEFPDFRLVYKSQHIFVFVRDDEASVRMEFYSRRNNQSLHVYSSNEVEFDKLKGFTEEHIEAIKEATSSVYVLSQSPTGLELTTIGKIDNDLVRENYTEEVIKKYDYSISQLSSAEPFGKFCLLHGPPGTGKTHLVKGMFKELKSNVLIIIPSSLVPSIDGPSMINIFSRYSDEFDGKFITLVIEDADSCIASRECNNSSTISTLLNMSDGILGSCFNIRIVATTNAEHMDVDIALKRPGRMIATISVGNLGEDNASKIFKRLTKGVEKEYEEEVTLSKIYEDANKELGKAMSLEKEKPRRKLGFGN